MYKFRQQHIKAIFLIVTLLIFILPLNAQKSSSQLKKDKQKIENDIANTQRMLKNTEKNQKASLQQLSVLRQQISNREKLITVLNDEIAQMEEQQELNQQLIQSLQKKLNYMKSDYAQVVYMAYRNRRLMDKVTFILAADDFTQMFRRLRFYTVFSNNVRSQADKITKTQQELQQKNDEIIALKDAKLTVLSGKELEMKKLEVDRQKKTKKAEELKRQSQKLAADLKKKQQKRREVDAAIQKAIQREIAAANERAAKKNATKSGKASSSTSTTAASSKGTTTSSSKPTNTLVLTPEEKVLNNSFVSNRGRLPWPVAKGVKVTEFGNHPHPDVSSVMVESRGIDIMTAAGTSVRAVYEGEVISVMDVMGSKLVMIRHGEYVTIYQNLATINVSKGSKVSTKQTIGTVAKDVITNTYELHFEVRKNSTCLNPSEWLAKQ